MKSRLSRQERTVYRIGIASWFVLYLISFIVTWNLHDNPTSMWRWLYVAKYLALICLTIQLGWVVLYAKRGGIVPTIAAVLGGLALVGFFILEWLWLLVFGGVLFAAGWLRSSWPRILDLSHRLAVSYRKIAKSSIE